MMSSVEPLSELPDDAPSRGPDVAGHLRNLIVTRRLVAGDRVRADTIAQQLSVSATPVREALHSLHAEGFLDYQRNRGFVVARLSSDDIRDVFISIGLLGGELAARAARTCGAADLVEMKAVQESLRQADQSGDLTDVWDLVQRFYAQLHRLGQSPKIVSLVLTLDSYTPKGLFASTPGWLTTTLRYNDLLIAAFEAGEPDAARAAVRGHLGETAELLSARFDSYAASY